MLKSAENHVEFFKSHCRSSVSMTQFMNVSLSQLRDNYLNESITCFYLNEILYVQVVKVYRCVENTKV